MNDQGKSKIVDLGAARDKAKERKAKQGQYKFGKSAQKNKGTSKSNIRWYHILQLVVLLVIIAYGQTLCSR